MVAILLKSEGEERRLFFDKLSIQIGRVQGNDIILPSLAVSRRHAQIIINGSQVTVVDLGSANGTFIGKKKIQGKQTLNPQDEIHIEGFSITIESAILSTSVSGFTPFPSAESPASAQGASQEEFLCVAEPTTASVRKILNRTLITDADLEAFT